MTFGVTERHFDVLERSYLLEHPAQCLMSRNGSPQSQFLFYGHMLELPLAYVFGLRWLGTSGLQALTLFEALCAAVSLFLVYRLVRLWGGKARAAIAAQIVVTASLAFWRLASGGEERIAALAAILAFLFAFWHSLATGRAAWAVAWTVAVAMLVHLESVVLVPFAAVALFLLPAAWRPHRRLVARNLFFGVVAAGVVFVSVAAITTGVRTPRDLIEYVTFYHRSTGTDFFELSGAPNQGPGRIHRVLIGMAAFFGVAPWGRTALLVLTLLVAIGALGSWLRRRSTAASGREPDPASVRTLGIHVLVLCTLWTMHFAFYQPESIESWIVPLVLLVVIAAVLWSAIFPSAILVLAVITLPGNWSYMLRLHREDPLHADRRRVESVTRNGDVLLLQGGRVGGELTEGSLAMRYFLTMLSDRKVASLHDILHVGEGEFWQPAYRSAAELQAAIDSSVKVVTPEPLLEVYEKIAATGAIEIEMQPAAPGLLQVLAFRPRHEASFTPDQLSTGRYSSRAHDPRPGAVK
jgi:hypothetical protein